MKKSNMNTSGLEIQTSYSGIPALLRKLASLEMVSISEYEQLNKRDLIHRFSSSSTGNELDFFLILRASFHNPFYNVAFRFLKDAETLMTIHTCGILSCKGKAVIANVLAMRDTLFFLCAAAYMHSMV